MLAGFAREDITPPMGTPILGTGLSTERLSESVNDPTYARVLALEHAGQRAMIIALDLCFLGSAESNRLKSALRRELDLRPEQILLNCSHTHAAAAASAYSDMLDAPELLKKYLDQLEPAVVKAARRATEARRDVRIKTGMGRTNLPMNRRQPRDGTIVNAPNPPGPVLNSLPLCLIEDAKTGEPVCLLFAASTHPVCMRRKAISADYPGAAMAALDAHLGRTCSLFMQGAGCGNSRPAALSLGREWNFGSDWKEAKSIGEQLARDAIAGLASLKSVEPELRSAMVEARFPFAPLPRAAYESVVGEAKARIDAANPASQDQIVPLRRQWAERMLAAMDQNKLPRDFVMSVQGIQIGNGVRLVALECEPMAEHGHAMEKAFAGGTTFALGYSNGDGIYLITSPMLSEGGYEVDSYWEYNHPAPLAPGIERVLAGAMARLKDSGIE